MTVRTRSQTFNPGELPLVLLALAEQEPMKAYEFLAELDRLFGPDYRSSPGGVYPALTALRVERLLSAEPDGRAKRYHLTRAGCEALDKRRDQLATIEERTGVNVRKDGSLRPVLDRFVQRVMKRSGRLHPADVEDVLGRAACEIEALSDIEPLKGASHVGQS